MVTPGQLNRRAQLYDQLASMIAAGVPLEKSLSMASRNASVRVSQKIIHALIGHLQAGHTFADSMKKVQGWLPEFDISLLSAGEHSGQLDASFRLLARYYATRARIIRNTIAGLIVTIATLHVLFLVAPLPLLVKFAQGIMDSSYSECVPFILEKIAFFGGVYGLFALFIFACQGNRGEGWRSLVESIFGLVPMLGTALKYLALARLATALDALLNAGVYVGKSWELSAAASGSPQLKREVLKWTPQFESGVTPAEMVNQISYFPEVFANLYQSGEISGKTDETLGRLNTYFEEEGFRMLQMFCRILNGIIYGAVALTVAIYVINFWKHYYGAELGSVLNGN
jgi:type IV pilus assembly protein PilC